jgi:hypothetical protein
MPDSESKLLHDLTYMQNIKKIKLEGESRMVDTGAGGQ